MSDEDERLSWDRRDEMCLDRGPRIGDEVMYCVKRKNHRSREHVGDELFQTYGWYNI